MKEGGWTSKESADMGDKMVEGMIAGLESTDRNLEEAVRRMHKAIVVEYEKQERKDHMKIEDCEYCTKNDCSFGEDFNVKGLGVSANIMFSDNYYAIYIVTESSDGLMEINYCPMCGRNLYED